MNTHAIVACALVAWIVGGLLVAPLVYALCVVAQRGDVAAALHKDGDE